MYTPRFGMNYVTQQAVTARLGATSRVRTNEAQAARLGTRGYSRDDEAGALWRMLSIVAVVTLVAAGAVLAIWVGRL